MTVTTLAANLDLDPKRLCAFGIFPSGVVAVAAEVDDHLGVTILAGHHGEVCRQLAGAVEHRFDGLDVMVTDDGAATLEDGLARFDCSVYREVEAGDHVIVILQLHAVEHADTSLPLVFHRSGFGRMADSA